MISHAPDAGIAIAADLRRRLWALEAERVDALAAGLGGNALYMDDLEDEIVRARDAFVGHAVTAIAMLRAATSGPLQG
jgi:hypothetical protein